MRVVVAGAGVIGFQVVKMLVANRHDVVVIDQDREVCEAVYADTGAVILHGNATDIRILEKAGVRKSDVMTCLVRNDSDNIACALLAKSLGIPSIIALLRKPDYEEAYRTVGVTQIISTTDLLAHQLLVEIEQPKVRKILSIGGGKAEIYAVHIPGNAKIVGLTIKEITQEKSFPQDCVFMGIYHEDRDIFSIPRGEHRLDGLDTVFLVSNSQNIKKATDFLTR
jgi:trk system potassium uptake protein